MFTFFDSSKFDWTFNVIIFFWHNVFSRFHDNLNIFFFLLAGWKVFPSVNLPEFFNYGHIYQHFITSMAQEDGEDIHTKKPLEKGRTYFSSGCVMEMKDIKKNDHYFLKSNVMASYDTSKLYKVSVTICTFSGAIKDSSCTCVAMALGRCSQATFCPWCLDTVKGLYSSSVHIPSLYLEPRAPEGKGTKEGARDVCSPEQDPFRPKAPEKRQTHNQQWLKTCICKGAKFLLGDIF